MIWKNWKYEDVFAKNIGMYTPPESILSSKLVYVCESPHMRAYERATHLHLCCVCLLFWLFSYVESLEIMPLSFVLTITTRAGEDVAALVKLIGHHPLLCRLFLVLAHVDSAPLMFTKFPPENQVDQKLYTVDGLRQTLVNHYVVGALQNTKYIIGSHEFLGAPRVLFNSLGTGFTDFIQKPVKGLASSPTDFGQGVVDGSKSLFKNSIHGFFNTTSKVTGALSKGAAAIAYDTQRQVRSHAELSVSYHIDSLFDGSHVQSEPVRKRRRERRRAMPPRDSCTAFETLARACSMVSQASLPIRSQAPSTRVQVVSSRYKTNHDSSQVGMPQRKTCR